MGTSLNKAGVSNANAKIAAGAVDRTSSWSFSADDGNSLLGGSSGSNWANYSKWHLGVDPSQKPDVKGHYNYPFGKNGKVYRSGIIAAKARAAAEGATAVEDAASRLLDRIDKKNMDENGLSTRAWATLEIKAIRPAIPSDPNSELTIEGIASTPNTDRMGDEVDPMGAKFKLPMPLLYQHNSRQPLGHVTMATPKKSGIPFTGTIARAGVTDWIDEARALVQEGLLKGVSIGFRTLKSEPVDPDVPYGGRRYKEWEWMELSVVTIPANADCTISAIRSYDSGDGAALGEKSSKVLKLPEAGDAAKVGKSSTSTKGKAMARTVAEQLAAFETKRAANLARMETLMAAASEEERGLKQEEEEEYDALKLEVEAIDKHLVRLRDHQKIIVDTAEAVDPNKAGGAGPTREQNQGGRPKQPEKKATPSYITPFRPNDNLPKGMAFTRYCMALAAGKGDTMRALERAKAWETSTPEVMEAIKAAVAPGTSTDATWAGPLVPLMPMASEFVEFLYPMTIIGRIAGFRKVPFNIKVPRQTAGAAASKWVGQDTPKPLSKLAFDSISVGFAKISTIIVLTEELVRFSNPAAEMLTRDDLAKAITKYMDAQFIDPNVAAVTNVSPASITNGATLVNATGSTVDSVTTDVASLLAEFTTHNIPMDNAYWVMNPRTAQKIGMLRTALGVFAFPTIDNTGGTFFGFPVVTSNNVPISAVSANETIAVLFKPEEILLADDGAITVDLSNEASLEMSDAPAGGATSLVSLWQNNLIGLRAERYINWLPRRSHVVAVWDGLAM